MKSLRGKSFFFTYQYKGKQIGKATVQGEQIGKATVQGEVDR